MREVGYAQFTANVSPTATTEGTANSVVSLGAITYDNVPHLLQFFAVSARPDTGAAGRTMTLVLFDDTTPLGWWAVLITSAAAASNAAISLEHRLTPTAASHTYNVKAFVNAGTGLIRAGAGGAGTDLPGFLRATRIPT